MAGKARRASIFPPLWPPIDGFRSLDRWTANLRSLDCDRRPAPRRARNALILQRAPRTAGNIERRGSRADPPEQREFQRRLSPTNFDSLLSASPMNFDSVSPFLNRLTR